MVLTARQCQYMTLVAEGHSNKAIGHALGVSTETVRNELNYIYRLLGVTGRTAAAVLLLTQGIIGPVTVLQVREDY